MPDDYFEINLSRVPYRPPVDWNNHNRSQDDYRQLAGSLRQVQLGLADGSLDAQRLQAMQRSSDPSEKALGAAFHEFYTQDRHTPPTVTWTGERYEVETGHHRLAAAHEAGLTHVPARVQADDLETLRELRADGERVAAADTPQRTAPEQASRAGTPLWERRSSNPERSRGERIGY